MRLTELRPRWCNSLGVQEGSHQGLTFDCPHCKAVRLGVWFDVPVGGGPAIDFTLWRASRNYDHPNHQSELRDTHFGRKYWHREGDSFENLTLTPSIDASEWGCWHGHITNGEVR